MAAVEWRRYRTYACQLGATVTALRAGSLLLDVQISVLATGCPDDADFVGGGVVWHTPPLSVC